MWQTNFIPHENVAKYLVPPLVSIPPVPGIKNDRSLTLSKSIDLGLYHNGQPISGLRATFAEKPEDF